MQLNSRMDKIKFLQNIKEGKTTIQELMPLKVELWKQHVDEPDIFISESTGEQITAAEMEVKEKTKAGNILFVTIVTVYEPLRDED